MMDWVYLEKLTNFWEKNLFEVKCINSDPLQAHVDVENHLAVSQVQTNLEFGFELLGTTIDELFEGENAAIKT
jgi:hypothetical protein